MYGEKSIYCSRCEKNRWAGAICSASEKKEPCIDSDLERIKKEAREVLEKLFSSTSKSDRLSLNVSFY
jgi:alpha-L-fucosidase